MKKVLFMLMMVLATMGMASCGGSNEDDATKELSEQLEAGDVNKFQSALENIKAKATTLLAENPEKAKELISKVQEFLNANKEKVANLIGSNETIANLVNTITSTTPDEVVNTLAGALGTQVQQGQEALQDQAGELLEGAQEQAGELIEGAQEKAGEVIEGAQEKAGELIDGAQQKAGELIDGAQKELGL